jgi:hypothetical protein
MVCRVDTGDQPNELLRGEAAVHWPTISASPPQNHPAGWAVGSGRRAMLLRDPTIEDAGDRGVPVSSWDPDVPTPDSTPSESLDSDLPPLGGSWWRWIPWWSLTQLLIVTAILIPLLWIAAASLLPQSPYAALQYTVSDVVRVAADAAGSVLSLTAVVVGWTAFILVLVVISPIGWVVAAVLCVVYIFSTRPKRRRAERIRAGICPDCAQQLLQTQLLCPECGSPRIEPETLDGPPPRPGEERRPWAAVRLIGRLILLVAIGLVMAAPIGALGQLETRRRAAESYFDGAAAAQAAGKTTYRVTPYIGLSRTLVWRWTSELGHRHEMRTR